MNSLQIFFRNRKVGTLLKECMRSISPDTKSKDIIKKEETKMQNNIL